MNREVARRRPAQVLHQAPLGRVLPPPMRDLDLETWTGSRHELAARLSRAVRRGEVAEAGAWVALAGSPGWYSVEVRRLKKAAPAWRPWVIGGAAALMVPLGLGVAAYVLMPVWLGLVLMVLGVLMAVAGVALKVRSGRSIVINQVVNVRK